MTKSQAVALLSRLPSVESVVVFAFGGHGPKTPQILPAAAPPAAPPPVTTRCENPSPGHGLERLGLIAALSGRKLLHFHYAACAYAGGATSLNEVARELGRRRKALERGLRRDPVEGSRRKNSLPHKVVAHAGTLSDWFTDLESEVFAPFFGQPSFTLRFWPRGKGAESVLGPDGYRALAATRDYLALINCPLAWPDPDGGK